VQAIERALLSDSIEIPVLHALKGLRLPKWSGFHIGENDCITVRASQSLTLSVTIS